MTDRKRPPRQGEGRPRIGESQARNRVVRVPDEVWRPAQAEAKRRGERLSEAIRRFLARYARKKE